MSDDNATESADGPKGLREALERKEAENAELLAQNNQLTSKLMASAFKEAGLDPLEGLGKAVAKLYEGEPEADAIARYAQEEYGWQPVTSTSNAGTEQAQAQQRVDQAMSATQPLTAQPELANQIQEAERAGDWTTALALKTEQARALHQGNTP